ncbi:hypothetical protein GCM10022402_09600 [Salinactinospora qingdaonensis]|uniref:Uncharacterized protein n=1 Tax=Salinactinospora qingdaonensis TaxID=702744 RepID=A0ABP7F4Q2_9ACTN
MFGAPEGTRCGLHRGVVVPRGHALAGGLNRLADLLLQAPAWVSMMTGAPGQDGEDVTQPLIGFMAAQDPGSSRGVSRFTAAPGQSPNVTVHPAAFSTRELDILHKSIKNYYAKKFSTPRMSC